MIENLIDDVPISIPSRSFLCVIVLSPLKYRLISPLVSYLKLETGFQNLSENQNKINLIKSFIAFLVIGIIRIKLIFNLYCS